MVNLMSADDFDLYDHYDEVTEYRQQFEELLYLMTGTSVDLSGSLLSGMSYYVDKTTASWSSMMDAEAEAAGNVEKYQTAVDAANAIQKTFVENLVNGVRDGGMSLEQVEGILAETFANTYNGAELVQQIMAQVTAELEGAAEASEGMSAGMENTQMSAEQVNAAIAPIIAQMEE